MIDPMSVEPTAPPRTRRFFPTRLRSRGFIGPIVVIGGVQLMATMDGPIAVFALPRIQSELGLSDAGRSWVITAYLLTFGGLILLGGRLGDAVGRKRTLMCGVALFTLASVLCAASWSGGVLVVARLLQGLAGAIVAPTCLALVATTFPKGRARNAAVAIFGAMAGIGVVIGLVVGGVLTEVSWRLTFLVNLPIGLSMIYLARNMLQETQKERLRLDAAGAALATLFCTAAAFGFSIGPEQGWSSALTIGLGFVALSSFVAFVMVERTAENPIVPLSLFHDGNRVATFVALFLLAGVNFSLTVVIAMYMQNVMGYTPLRAGLSYIPLAIAMAVGQGIASRLVTRFAPRVIVITGAFLVLNAMVYCGLTINPGIAYFPHLVLPIVVGVVGMGMMNVALGLSVISSVGVDRIGPTSAIAVMLQNLGGPLVLVAIQVVVTMRTLHLGGAAGPVTGMNSAQLHALDRGYTYGLFWLVGVVVVLAVVALRIRYTAQEVAHAQKVKKVADAE
jgi:EmrB/QacA subfamily drug resistance transporter